VHRALLAHFGASIMQKQIAKHIVTSALRAASQLNQILPFAQTYCDSSEYQKLLASTATAIDCINLHIVDDILAAHPDLKQEIDDSIANHGVVI
jgi:hypothetical protein